MVCGKAVKGFVEKVGVRFVSVSVRKERVERFYLLLLSVCEKKNENEAVVFLEMKR